MKERIPNSSQEEKEQKRLINTKSEEMLVLLSGLSYNDISEICENVRSRGWDLSCNSPLIIKG